jgi:hypothetical protein
MIFMEPPKYIRLPSFCFIIVLADETKSTPFSVTGKVDSHFGFKINKIELNKMIKKAGDDSWVITKLDSVALYVRLPCNVVLEFLADWN